MAAISRDNTLTAGFLLIALGAIFLAENFIPSFSSLSLIARYWPLILIAIGLKRLYRFFVWPSVPPAPDRIPRKE